MAPVAEALLFVGALVVYLSTAYPTISGGDAGEMAYTVCGEVGVAHPPGYPLWTWLGVAFNEGIAALNLPVPDRAAWRIGALSAFANAGGALFVSRSATLLAAGVGTAFHGEDDQVAKFAANWGGIAGGVIFAFLPVRGCGFCAMSAAVASARPPPCAVVTAMLSDAPAEPASG